MPKINYVPKSFQDTAKQIIKDAEEILDENAADGYQLTLRQLYYQMFSRGKFPDKWKDPITGSTNNFKSYKKLGEIMNDARLAGMIDWNHLEDRTRNLERLGTWDNPQQIIDIVSEQYRRDLWRNQDYMVELWVEKEALANVIERAARQSNVPWFCCRGFVSASEMWRAGQRLLRYIRAGKQVVILHVGDHDPSGIDMTRDIRDRLRLFIGTYSSWEVKRIALNIEQVEAFNLPPNPTKSTDARSEAYVAEFGEECWEVDAIPPADLVEMIQTEIEGYKDQDQWEEDEADVEREREGLVLISENLPAVFKFVRDEE